MQTAKPFILGSLIARMISPPVIERDVEPHLPVVDHAHGALRRAKARSSASAKGRSYSKISTFSALIAFYVHRAPAARFQRMAAALERSTTMQVRRAHCQRARRR
nr:hypothetical protein [Deltaproteobacteria bacterium]